ncbi:arginine-hydroxylase NDUFAF5, mitochondrial-like isoform X2 [Lytechinus variegatus]|uniref:arginine-hydroxylase NDUFAF5, mitochondrial-like isoform X2 n=1 Tax=Lytechinus variegatus TaxID=7654 RepID=UPI001BB21EE1|nr:arginine-hydroxylase NDUFAF5, mitochondrial-like isoform X2 [Lytechinus variegatus]
MQLAGKGLSFHKTGKSAMFHNCQYWSGVLSASFQTRINRHLLKSSLAGSAWKGKTSCLLQTKQKVGGKRSLLASGYQHFLTEKRLGVGTFQSPGKATMYNHQGIHRQRTSLRSVFAPTSYSQKVSRITRTVNDYLCSHRKKIDPKHLASECGFRHLSRYQQLFRDQRNLFVTRRSLERNLSTSSNLCHPARGESVMNVFDRKTKRKQRDRAALAKDVEVYDYIKDEIAYRMVDRIRDVTRKFPVAVDLGCGRGLMANYLTEDEIGTLYQCEMSEKMLDQVPTPEGVKTIKLVADEEFVPFKEESLDLVISSLSLHWVNDLPGTLRQIHTALKKDGAFIGAIFGGDTLFELRCSLQLAELEREGGFAPHISPFADMQDIGNLLSRSGYNMLTVDKEELQVNYPSMYELMHDLKGMAENNASWSRKNYLQRDTMAAAAAIYKDMYGNEDGTIPATFQVLFMIGWKPDQSQAKPAARGSATASLKDLDKLNMDVPPKE